MRLVFRLLAAVTAASSLVACAHTHEEMHASTMVTDREVIAVERTVDEDPPPPPRPRLSRTITLGQGAEPTYTPSAPQPAAQAPAGPNVVVNNNVYVQDGPRYYGGYGWGGYGYGGYGGYGDYGGRATTSSEGRGGSWGPSQWGTTGWEGARRTAAPGQTPGVGGNWAPPPSYGPAQMK